MCPDQDESNHPGKPLKKGALTFERKNNVLAHAKVVVFLCAWREMNCVTCVALCPDLSRKDMIHLEEPQAKPRVRDGWQLVN